MSATSLPTPEFLLAEFRASSTNDARAALQRLSERLHSASAAPGIWQQVAERLLGDGDVAVAISLLGSGLSVYSKDPGLRCVLGNALRMQGRYTEAEHELRGALAADPASDNVMWSLAFLLREQGRFNAAAEVVLAHQDRREADAARNTATFLAQCNHQAEALEVCRRALAFCANPKLLELSGILASTLGLFGAASTDLRNAVKLDPNQATAWLWLALAHKFQTRDDPDLMALEEAAAEHSGLSDDSRICIGFGLGKAYDDLDDIPAAVLALRRANAAMAVRKNWQSGKWADFVARQLTTPVPAPVTRSGISPIFVVGLPRTGTTLVATLLAQHPHIRNRGELGWLAEIAEQGAPHGYPRGFLSRAAELYGAQLRQDDEPASYYLDKNPSNFQYLGLAASMFPEARVIHCQRDRRDTALSIWRQHFTHADTGYTYRFSDIADVGAGHDRLMEHWRAALPLPIYSLHYENMVARPDETLADLLRFLDLDDNYPASGAAGPSVAIGTASVWQARQPIYSSAVGRWHAYAEYLPELTETFPD